MICVIADDLTGAAELAGVAWRCGLQAEVQTEFAHDPDLDVIALDCNTRALAAEQAAANTGRICEEIRRHPWQLIYKKTDSVLRGNPRAELETMMVILPAPRCWLVPANPSRQRIVRDGRYRIADVPLHETAFGRDPQHPAHSDRVTDLLSSVGRESVHAGTAAENPHPHGILLKDADSAERLCQLAHAIDSMTLPAGGVDFFKALLSERGLTRAKPPTSVPRCEPRLIVCGSAAAWETRRSAKVPIVCRPQLDDATSRIQAWTDAVVRAFDGSNSVMVAIGGDEGLDADQCIHDLSQVVAETLSKVHVRQLFTEGGATSSAIVRQMGWHRCRVSDCPDERGDVVALTPLQAEITVFTKPGSYDWPSSGDWDAAPFEV